jgi:hypothetical protein
MELVLISCAMAALNCSMYETRFFSSASSEDAASAVRITTVEGKDQYGRGMARMGGGYKSRRYCVLEM